MTTWRNPTYMRRRQMRLMAEEQQRLLLRLQRQHLQAAMGGLADMAQQMAAQVAALPPLFGPSGPADDLADQLDATAAADGQLHRLKTGLH